MKIPYRFTMCKPDNIKGAISLDDEAWTDFQMRDDIMEIHIVRDA